MYNTNPILIKWLVEAGVCIAREKKHRLPLKELVSTGHQSRSNTFTFTLKRGGEKCEQVAYVPSLPVKIIELL